MIKNISHSFRAAILFAILNVQTGKSNAQIVPCAFDIYNSLNNINVQTTEQQINNFLSQNLKQRKLLKNNIFKIPVVVHIIHNGGPENISDAQVESQIEVLNQDYRKILGTNGYGAGVDTEIEFCLARLDPDGDCTNGIVRILSPLTYHDSYERPLLSQLSSWDPSRYLNIYVVKTIAGSVLGYASFPGGPTNQDGVVMVHFAFGTIGTVQLPYNLGRTCTHEIGHWLGLYHTFNGGCGTDTCTDGDFVCDTPPVINPNFSCSTINTCSIDTPDVNDQVENYMDYTNDDCKNIFTYGQRSRMQAALNTARSDVWTPSNIISTGCDSGFVPTACNVVADFIANGTQICQNNTIAFSNKTLNNATSFLWSFQGGNPSTDTTLNPIVTYDSLGTFDVILIAFGPLGSDTLTLNNYINVSQAQPGQSIPYDETFEQLIFPSNGITIDNPDNGITWERDTVAVMFEGYAAAKINNLINTNYGQSDALILPAYDFTTFSGTPFLSFRWAYAKSDVNYSDELLVLVSSDCGLTFSQEFYRTGNSMTTGPTQSTPYIPDSNTIWKQGIISLDAYSAFNNVLIKIVNVTDGGNNLYIDSLHLGSNISTGVDELNSGSINIFPNPYSNNLTIEFLHPVNGNINLTLYDALGKKLDFTSFADTRNSTIIKWQPQSSKNIGMQILEIRTDDNIIRKKIVRH